MTFPADPITPAPPRTPIGDALRTHLDGILTRVPSGARGAVTATVNKAGAEVEAGVRKALTPTLDLTGSGFAAKFWRGGWDAGARVGLVWR